jgi:hypothetical protein
LLVSDEEEPDVLYALPLIFIERAVKSEIAFGSAVIF